jgi:hypothetical protein
MSKCGVECKTTGKPCKRNRPCPTHKTVDTLKQKQKFKVYVLHASGPDDYGALGAENYGLNRILGYCIDQKINSFYMDQGEDGDEPIFDCHLSHYIFDTLDDAQNAVEIGKRGKEANDYDHSKSENVFFFYQDEDEIMYDEDGNDIDIDLDDETKNEIRQELKASKVK